MFELIQQAGHIFGGVILPILLLIALGALLQRFQPLHIPTLAKLNIYLFVPAFLFVNVAQSKLTWTQIGGVVSAVLLPMAMIGVPLYAALRRAKAGGTIIGAMVIGGLVFNAGNFGIPVAVLLYETNGWLRFPGMAAPTDGTAVQALIVMMTNLSLWCLGYIILSLAKGDGMKGAMGYFKLPMIYVIAAAFLVKETQVELPNWVAFPLKQLALAIVPVSLITLGAQLAQRARWPRWGVIAPVMSIKLLALPSVTAAVVYWLGLWPWPGAQLVIASAAPTAVNTLLLTLELEGDADTAADCVFWTTVFSALTVAVVIALVMRLGDATMVSM